jgi:hypothetical protein
MTILRLAATLVAGSLLTVFAVTLLDRPADAGRVPPVLRARAFELVDGRGQVRAQINVERGRQVVLRLRDREGAVRVKLGADGAGSGLLLLNESTEPGVQALATSRTTSLSLQRGEQRNTLVP